jgi:hypothetical protein
MKRLHVDAVLDLAADIAIKRFAPHFKAADAEEPFVNADGTVATLRKMKEIGSNLADTRVRGPIEFAREV